MVVMLLLYVDDVVEEFDEQVSKRVLDSEARAFRCAGLHLSSRLQRSSLLKLIEK